MKGGLGIGVLGEDCDRNQSQKDCIMNGPSQMLLIQIVPLLRTVSFHGCAIAFGVECNCGDV